MSSSRNRGWPDDRREALKGAVDYTKLLATLATGTVVLSATFLDKFFAGEAIGLLIGSWVGLALSVLAGLVAYGDYINQFAESTFKVRGSTMEVANLLQWLLVGVGIGLFTWFVVVNVIAAPKIQVARDESGIHRKTAVTTVVCPSAAVDGCTGNVTFRLLRSHGMRSLGLGTTPFAIEHPGLSRVSSPRSLSAAEERSHASDRLEIFVYGQGRYGNATTVTEIVPLTGGAPAAPRHEREEG